MAGPFYVDPDGDDSTGLDWTHAWQSLQSALDTAAAGEIIYCRGTETIAAPIDVDTNEGSNAAGFIKVIGCNASGNVDGTRYIIDAEGNNVDAINIAGKDLYWWQNIETRNTGTEDGFYTSTAGTGHVFINCCAYNCTVGFRFTGCHGFLVYRCVAYGGTYGFNSDGYSPLVCCCAHDNTSYGFGNTRLCIGCLSYDNLYGFYTITYNGIHFNCVAEASTTDGFVISNAGNYHVDMIGCRVTNTGTMGVECNDEPTVIGWSYFEDNTGDNIQETTNFEFIPKDDNTTTNQEDQADTNEGYTNKGDGTEDLNLRSDATLRREAISIPTS